MSEHTMPASPGDIPAEAREFYITGGPGCGKTAHLSRHIAKAVASGRNPLVLSLTRNAAAEAASRNPELHQSRIGTIHHFCYQALNSPKIADNPQGIREWNESNFLYAMSESRERDEFSPQTGQTSAHHPDLLMAEYQRLRATLQPLPEDGPLAEFATKWRNWCNASDAIDFNGLLERSIAEGVPPPGDPGLIFVDEAQDLTPLELRLLRQWSATGIPLVLAGDPNQNLYQWRGADNSALANLAHVAAEFRQTLTQSRRVPREIHAAALEWMAQCPTRPTIDYQPQDAPGEVQRIAATWHQPEPAIALAEEQAAQGRKVMILASCAYMLLPAINHLRRAGIPFHNPWRTHNLDWNPNAPAPDGVRPSHRILAYAGFDPASPDANDRAVKWTAMLEKSAAFTDPRHGMTQLQRLSPDSDRQAQAQMIASVVTPQALEAAAGSDLRWLAEHLAPDGPPEFRYIVNVAARNGAASADRDSGVTVGTIHSVKGAECDAAYVFPDLALPAMRDWLGNANQQAAIYRQFYVAMTRPKESLTLCAPAGAMATDL